ncbi:MAG: zinc-dependent alcohol dehydrogenase [Candidatus Kariarchaeaceae archaeon]|jgi:threonine dehydrogenase-like Zn-dependent dehydrogenase
MKAGFVERNFFKAGLVKALNKIWPGVIFSRLSPFNVAEMDQPEIEFDTEVLVDHIYSGICGSDISLLNSRADPRVAPAALSRYNRIYLGHEILARITKVGPAVEGFEVGDRVTVMHGQTCALIGREECHSCQSGLPYLCKNTSQKSSQHLDTGGGWAPHWKYDYRQLMKIPDDISDEHAVMTEPLGVGIHAVLRRPPKAGEKVLVYGAGFIGMATLIAAKYFAPDAEVYVLTRYDFQAEMVEANGGIPLREQDYTKIAELTDAYHFKGLLSNEMLLGGFDVVYDCVSTDDTIKNSVRWSRARGTVVLVGVHLYLSSIDLTPVWYQEVDLIGSYGRGREEFDDRVMDTDEIAFEIYRSGMVDPSQLITHKMRLSEYREAINVLANKKKSKAMKVVFDYTD